MTMNELNRLIGRTMRALQLAPESRRESLRAACCYLNEAKRALRVFGPHGDEIALSWVANARLAVIVARLR